VIRRAVGVACRRRPASTPPTSTDHPVGDPGPLGIGRVRLAPDGVRPAATGRPPRPAAADRQDDGPLLVAGRGGTATVALSSIPTTLNDHTVAGDTDATRLVASAVWVQVFQVGPT
jgi:hypothetical protein